MLTDWLLASRLLLLGIVGGTAACSGGDQGPEPPELDPAICAWTPWPDNPVITSNWSAGGDLLINDPSVMAEPGGYRVWFSQGPGLGINHVKVYEGSSSDGVNWTRDPSVLLEPVSAVTVSGSSSPDVSGIYELVGEDAASFVNDKPAYALPAGGWFLWFDPTWMNYRLSDAMGSDGTASWIGAGGTIVDGDYASHSGAAAGTPSALSEWDSEKVETPMVLKVGSTFHMYYSGFKVGDLPGAYNLGHATSPDGTVWTKDPNNPVIRGGSDPAQWGFYQAAEPGVLYDAASSMFYAYYVTAKDRGPQYAGTDQQIEQGIAVATSVDGSDFTFQQMALTQSAAYPIEENYVGYSTPFALIDSIGTFHLFYDVAQIQAPGDWRQVALAHASSSDGLTFSEIETDIFVFQDVPWRTHEVRSPSVIEEDGIFKMWFAGHNDLFFQPGFTFDIGYATSDTICR